MFPLPAVVPPALLIEGAEHHASAARYGGRKDSGGRVRREHGEELRRVATHDGKADKIWGDIDKNRFPMLLYLYLSTVDGKN